jgi:hypothetical protein
MDAVLGWKLVVSLPAILLIALLAGRLLGVQRSLAATALAGAAGWLSALALSLAIADGGLAAAGFTRNLWVFAIVFTMSATVWIELLAKPGALARAQSGLVSVPPAAAGRAPLQPARQPLRADHRHRRQARLRAGAGPGQTGRRRRVRPLCTRCSPAAAGAGGGVRRHVLDILPRLEPWDSRFTVPLPCGHQRRSAGLRPTGSDGSLRTRQAAPAGLAGWILLDAWPPGARRRPWSQPTMGSAAPAAAASGETLCGAAGKTCPWPA